MKFKKLTKELVKTKKKSKITKGKILKKPTQKLPSYDSKRILLKGEKKALVTEGRTGYFNKELMEEVKWLS
jgi:hypothetical protein